MTSLQSKLIEAALIASLIVGVLLYIDHINGARDALLLDQLHQHDAQNALVVQQLQQQNSVLTSAATALQAAAALAKTQVIQLPPTQLAQQTQQQLGTGVVVATPNSQFSLDTPAMQAVLQNLIQEKADEQTIIDGKQIIANDAMQITTLQSTIKDDASELALCKADASRVKRKWFFIGVIVGFVGRQLLK